MERASLVAGVAARAHRLDPRVRRRRSPASGGLRLLAHVRQYLPEPNGGAEVSFHAVLAGLRELGHGVEVVSESAREPYRLDGIPITSSVSGTTSDRYQRADAVLSIIDPPSLEVRREALRHGTALVMFDYSGAVLGDRPRSVDLWVLNAQWLRDQLPADVVDRSVVVHSPVDPGRYRVEPGDHVTLVNLTDAKGAPQFYELARRLPDVQFLGVRGAWGTQVPVPALPNLHVVPNAPDPRSIYRQTRVLASPSIAEVHPRSPLEAAASGIPCIAHPNPGTLEALGPAGIYVHRDDLDGWCREIRRLQDPHDYSEASCRVRSHVAGGTSRPELERLAGAIASLVA